MDGVILHDFEREKASAKRDKSEHRQGDRVNKQRFARAFAAALPTLRKEQRTGGSPKFAPVQKHRKYASWHRHMRPH